MVMKPLAKISSKEGEEVKRTWLDSEDGFRTGCRNVSHQKQSFSDSNHPDDLFQPIEGMLLLSSNHFLINVISFDRVFGNRKKSRLGGCVHDIRFMWLLVGSFCKPTRCNSSSISFQENRNMAKRRFLHVLEPILEDLPFFTLTCCVSFTFPQHNVWKSLGVKSKLFESSVFLHKKKKMKPTNKKTVIRPYSDHNEEP